MRRLFPVLACSFAYLAFTFPSGALANDPELACKLAGPDIGKQTPFGNKKHPAHVIERPSHGVTESDGAYNSNCGLFVYHTLPKTKKDPFGGPPRYRVAPGLTKVTISVTTEDDEELETGSPWNPGAIHRDYLVGVDGSVEAYGGGHIGMPLYGQEEVQAFWVGHRNNFALALWSHEQDEGFIDMSLQHHGSAGNLLDLLASEIVPRFNP